MTPRIITKKEFDDMVNERAALLVNGPSTGPREGHPLDSENAQYREDMGVEHQMMTTMKDLSNSRLKYAPVYSQSVKEEMTRIKVLHGTIEKGLEELNKVSLSRTQWMKIALVVGAALVVVAVVSNPVWNTAVQQTFASWQNQAFAAGCLVVVVIGIWVWRRRR